MNTFVWSNILACFLVMAFIPSWSCAETLQERQQKLEHLFEGPCARFQVPKQLALAIARQESGMYLWILNISGRDVRPANKAEALRLARAALAAGRSFDVGVMQVNSYWIRKYKLPLERLLEPGNNIFVGVWILAQEVERHGMNWKAVAYYHTPVHKNPERGRRYALTIYNHLKNIQKGR